MYNLDDVLNSVRNSINKTISNNKSISNIKRIRKQNIKWIYFFILYIFKISLYFYI